MARVADGKYISGPILKRKKMTPPGSLEKWPAFSTEKRTPIDRSDRRKLPRNRQNFFSIKPLCSRLSDALTKAKIKLKIPSLAALSKRHQTIKGQKTHGRVRCSLLFKNTCPQTGPHLEDSHYILHGAGSFPAPFFHQI